ncbi:hypothetical protein CK221_29015 [Mesorhizobium sp. WSM3868]|nr:hypothetical protein CK221_29015 [Mesorhizobium sp. WSM3868]
MRYIWLPVVFSKRRDDHFELLAAIRVAGNACACWPPFYGSTNWQAALPCPRMQPTARVEQILRPHWL